jgi:2-oxoisovalerate dehydrogenase E1 component
MLQILNEKSELIGTRPDLSDEQLLEMYSGMVLIRNLDRKFANLNLQGRMASYYKMEGQDAQFAAGMALDKKNDWLVPAYRDMGIWHAKGMGLETIARLWMGAQDYKWDVTGTRISSPSGTVGTHVAHGTGVGYITKIEGRSEVCLTVCGDGATSTPDFSAALNFAGVWKTNTIFLVQNNGWAEETPFSQQTASASIAVRAKGYGLNAIEVDGMDPLAVYAAVRQSREYALSGNGATLIDMKTYRYSPHMVSAFDPRPQEEQDYWLERDPVPRFEIFLRREGLLNDAKVEAIQREANQRVEAVVALVENAEKDVGTPGVEYLVRNTYEKVHPTLQEQAAEWAEFGNMAAPQFADSEKWEIGHDQVPTGGETRKWCIREALNAALDHAMSERANTVILGEDVALVGGQFRVTANLMDKYGKGRVVDTPLCEIGILGTAIGMALAGARPVAEIMFAGFTNTAIDQIIGHAARWRWRYKNMKTMPLVVRMGHGSGVGAHEYHIDSPETMFAHAPGLIVVYPSSPIEAKGLLAAALESEDPVIFFEPMLMYNTPRELVPVEHYTLPLGRAAIKAEGADVTVVTYGNMVPVCIKAAKSSTASVEVIDLRTISPWDQETVLKSVEKTGRLVVVTEPCRTAGIGSDIVATVSQKAFLSMNAAPVQVTGLDGFRPVRQLEKLALIQSNHVITAIDKVMAG